MTTFHWFVYLCENFLCHRIASQQAFSQTLKTGCPGGMFSHKIIRDLISEFSLNFFKKWASTGCLDTPLAKALLLSQISWMVPTK